MSIWNSITCVGVSFTLAMALLHPAASNYGTSFRLFKYPKHILEEIRKSLNKLKAYLQNQESHLFLTHLGNMIPALHEVNSQMKQM